MRYNFEELSIEIGGKPIGLFDGFAFLEADNDGGCYVNSIHVEAERFVPNEPVEFAVLTIADKGNEAGLFSLLEDALDESAQEHWAENGGYVSPSYETENRLTARDLGVGVAA